MSLYVKNMTMPANCTDCEFRKRATHEYISDCSKCPFSGEDTPVLQRRQDCPLIDVPTHGRLIDADVLIEQNRYLRYDPSHHEEGSWDAGWCTGFNAGAAHATEHAVYAHTIIAADSE